MEKTNCLSGWVGFFCAQKYGCGSPQGLPQIYFVFLFNDLIRELPTGIKNIIWRKIT